MSHVNIPMQVMRQFPNLTLNPGVCCCWTIQPSVSSCLCSSHWKAHIRHSKAIIYSMACYCNSLFMFLFISNCKWSTERRGDQCLNTHPWHAGNHLSQPDALWAGTGCNFPNKILQPMISHQFLWHCRKTLCALLTSKHVHSPTYKGHLGKDHYLGCGLKTTWVSSMVSLPARLIALQKRREGNSAACINCKAGWSSQMATPQPTLNNCMWHRRH